MPALTTTLDNVLKVYRIKQGMNVWSNVIACVQLNSYTVKSWCQIAKLHFLLRSISTSRAGFTALPRFYWECRMTWLSTCGLWDAS